MLEDLWTFGSQRAPLEPPEGTGGDSPAPRPGRSPVRLEDMTKGTTVRGLVPGEVVEVEEVTCHGTSAVEVFFKDQGGQHGCRLLFREDEAGIEIVGSAAHWSFDADPIRFRLASEALRLSLAPFFDPHLAVHTSLVVPMPHQIAGVYQLMLGRQPIRFLLADGRGSGKTIQVGLLMRELIARGDLRRCLVVAPAAQIEQWQDELRERFELSFDLLSGPALEEARTGGWLAEHDLVIGRLDRLGWDEVLVSKLDQVTWDLVVVDEAHRMTRASTEPGMRDTKTTENPALRLGRLLGRRTRHLVLLTASAPHDDDAELRTVLSLLDEDRFVGRTVIPTSSGVADLMRRLPKERVVRFNGTPLFPDRRMTTRSYRLSSGEAQVYDEVRSYVRAELARADRIGPARHRTAALALSALQRRVLSSPDAIREALRWRRDGLEVCASEEELLRRVAPPSPGHPAPDQLQIGECNVGEEVLDGLDDAPSAEVEKAERDLLEQASAARTMTELRTEIGALKWLEELVDGLIQSGSDQKWEALSRLLTTEREMLDRSGRRRKLVIFTDFRATVFYLAGRLGRLLGRHDAVVTLHGGMSRKERKKAQERFARSSAAGILVATDAALEGINLLRAPLMVNYDIAWSPEKLERRFSRIHRIGQTEICHLWSLVDDATPEGELVRRLFTRLEEASEKEGSRVYDLLGELFQERPFSGLLLEAILAAEGSSAASRVQSAVDTLASWERCHATLGRRPAGDETDALRVAMLRRDLDRAGAQKLQPHAVGPFFVEALASLGGSVSAREPGRWEVAGVPREVRLGRRVVGRPPGIEERYERITFEKELIAAPSKPLATYLSAGHPFFEAVLDLVSARFGGLLRRGAVLVDEVDPGFVPRAVFMVEQAVTDGGTGDAGGRVAAREIRYVEVGPEGSPHLAGVSPFLDLRPATEAEGASALPVANETWLRRDLLEGRLQAWLSAETGARLLFEAQRRRDQDVRTTLDAVRASLGGEIAALEALAKESPGRPHGHEASSVRRRAEELSARLARRTAELDRSRKLVLQPATILGVALAVPAGFFAGREAGPAGSRADETASLQPPAVAAVVEAEKRLGFEPRDVTRERAGWDVESWTPGQGRLRLLVVKGCPRGASTVTVSKSEMLVLVNRPDDALLAVVEAAGAAQPWYVRGSFWKPPSFAATQFRVSLADLKASAEASA